MSSEFFQKTLSTSHEFARQGKNTEFLQSCQALANSFIRDPLALNQIASLLLSYGFASQAKRCLDQAILLSSDNIKVLLSLALCELQLGSINRFTKITQELLDLYPNDLKVLGQALYLYEYLDQPDSRFLLTLAKRWGECAIELAGGIKLRPSIRRLENEPVRLGYVSSDFCQHTVGLLIKEVLRNHQKDLVRVYCYSNGVIKDWVTHDIASHSNFIDVSYFSDSELAARMEQDHIDVLIDLSGHTGGSRLTTFAYRPAPIMISMMGYYATTGLSYMDASLLDQYHMHEATQQDFVEPVISLPFSRWCYYPAFPAPLPAPPPVLRKGYITFGSFNNTLKYNPRVYALWAQILNEVPRARLILKWRSFNDQAFRQRTLTEFQNLGVDSSRIELRGPSFHMQMLEEYQDVDIALDPFPFSGGASSCEALYMGVPVITLPQVRVVSRQTFAYLSLIGLPELIANSEKEYLGIAKELASSPERLTSYRNQLRMEMIQSPLMDLKAYTSSLEGMVLKLFQNLKSC